MSSMAEKFQITVPYSEKKDDDGDKRVSAESQHVNHGVIHRGAADKFNSPPPGMEIDNALRGPDPCFQGGFGGNMDVSSELVTSDTLCKGFARLDMLATDDQFSGEHVDLFYGEAVSETGEVGFVERNNYLDRA